MISGHRTDLHDGAMRKERVHSQQVEMASPPHTCWLYDSGIEWDLGPAIPCPVVDTTASLSTPITLLQVVSLDPSWISLLVKLVPISTHKRAVSSLGQDSAAAPGGSCGVEPHLPGVARYPGVSLLQECSPDCVLVAPCQDRHCHRPSWSLVKKLAISGVVSIAQSGRTAHHCVFGEICSINGRCPYYGTDLKTI